MICQLGGRWIVDAVRTVRPHAGIINYDDRSERRRVGEREELIAEGTIPLKKRITCQTRAIPSCSLFVQEVNHVAQYGIYLFFGACRGMIPFMVLFCN